LNYEVVGFYLFNYLFFLKVVGYVFFSYGDVFDALGIVLEQTCFEVEFRLGSGRCGGGWDMAVEGMRVNERREVKLFGFVLWLIYVFFSFF
jgi:hypothetical protein